MDAPKTLLICKSTHHGNTWKIGQAMADVLRAHVVQPEEVDRHRLADFDLVGFGSGIYFGRLHSALTQLVDAFDRPPQRALLFSTAGLPFLSRLWHRGLRTRLERAGSRIEGEFCCRGWDTVGPLVLVGGFNRGHPDPRDLDRAREFARVIVERLRGHAPV